MIEIHRLVKRYGEKTAVDGLDFTVKPGVVTGFLGPNGAGKSTTMRMIVGLDAPTSGRSMPGVDGIEATRRIVASGSRSRVLVLTTFDLDEYAYGGLRAGASGFLLKDALPDELLAGSRAVAAGDAVAAPALTRRLLDAFVKKSPEPADSGGAETDSRLAGLTGREREVLLAMARGLTNTEIAELLVLSASTIKTHVGKVLAKIGASDRVHAVIIAYEAGIVGTDRPR
ncbi:LuxR C-terminal-related transcriptional regulator [Streptomyces sp. NPDC058470]|uniref:LuxR C-terminal-related transcriptional regulator n=1 Tax=Streptomyces sp. NPDC058470 TaxID=3346515 RepID=UPI00365D132F